MYICRCFFLLAVAFYQSGPTVKPLGVDIFASRQCQTRAREMRDNHMCTRAIKISASAMKATRLHCGHCDQNLLKTIYYQHKRLYYDHRLKK